MQWNLEQMRLFVSVAEQRSFSAVARQQRKAQSAVSNGIALLEADLGVSLFERSSGRQPRLSEAGTVLLEALVAGLPVLTTAVCGYAHYIEDADGGRVVPEPFAQETLNATLAEMLSDPAASARWQSNALAFAESADIYSNAERAADLILRGRA